LGLPRKLFPSKKEARSDFRRGSSVKRRFTVDKEGLPDLAGMMLATVEALRTIGSSATIEELDEKVIELEGVGEEEQSYMMAGSENRPRVNYYLAWARTFLKRGGALQNSARGVWSLTDKGMSLDSYGDVRLFTTRSSRKNGSALAGSDCAQRQRAFCPRPLQIMEHRSFSIRSRGRRARETGNRRSFPS
jgi:hypothetical protein